MKVHFEPYLVMGALTHKSALIAWGGFYFKVRREEGAWKLLDDGDLDSVHPPRRSSIGAKSDPYGPARVVLAGHEHNFQHARRDGIDYFVTGGGGKVRLGTPRGFAEAGTVTWAPEGHFLLVEIAGRRAVVTPVGRGAVPIAARDADGRSVDPVTTLTLEEEP